MQFFAQDKNIVGVAQDKSRAVLALQKPKPYYEDEAVTIYHGDCREIIPMLQFDIVITDPPYGTTQNEWDKALDLWNILPKSGRTIFTASEPFASKQIVSNLDNFSYDLVWEKSVATRFLDCSWRPLSTHERILIFGRGKYHYSPIKSTSTPWHKVRRSRQAGNWGVQKEMIAQNGEGSREPGSVLFFPNGNNKTEHPTQKPIELFRALILTYTNYDNAILDPFMGSGTTLRAAKDLGRKAIGIEIEEKYCRIAAERMAQTVLDLSGSASGTSYAAREDSATRNTAEEREKQHTTAAGQNDCSPVGMGL
jgi:site-specific DNA-methyltransferase (adenine-specific)